MKPIRLAVASLLILTSSLAQADCRTYLGGLTECSGPRGYQSTQRDYVGGVSESWDNRGNRATIRHHTGGETTVVAPTGVAPSVSPAPLYGGHGRGEVRVDSNGLKN